MHKIADRIEIKAPVSVVWSFLRDPRNLPRVFPSLVDIDDVAFDAGSNSFAFTYKMAGVRLHGRSDDVEVVPQTKVVAKTTGVPSTWRWAYEAKGARTILSCEIEYSIPTPVLGGIAEAVVAKINEHELSTILKNVKAAAEELVAAKPNGRPAIL